MPQIPTFAATPDAVTDRMPMADPSAFMAPGNAVAQAGAQLGDFGAEWEQRYVEAKREREGGTLNAQGTQGLGEIALRWSKVADQQKAIEGFTQDAQALRQKLLGQAPDPLVAGYVARNFDIEAAQQATQTRVQAFNREASAYRGTSDTALVGYLQSAALAPNDLARAHYTDMATQLVHGDVAAGWRTPEEGEQRVLQFRSDVATAQAKAMIMRDPSGAAEILGDPAKAQQAFPGMLPVQTDNLWRAADYHAARMEARANAAQAHTDATAQKNLEEFQHTNEAQLFIDMTNGKPLDLGQVSLMVHAQQLDPRSVPSLIAFDDRRDAGRNDPMTLIHAQEGALDGTLTRGDVHAAVAAGHLNAAAAGELIVAMSEKQKQQTDVVQRANFAALRTEFSASAVETGFAGAFGGEAQRAEATDMWGSAQREWLQRVYVQKQDSSAVLADMIARYQPGKLLGEDPIAGHVTNVADLNAAAVQTTRWHDAKQLTDAQYQQQVIILNRLRAILAMRGGTLPGAATGTLRPAPGQLRPPSAPAPSVPAPSFGQRLGNTFEDLAN